MSDSLLARLLAVSRGDVDQAGGSTREAAARVLFDAITCITAGADASAHGDGPARTSGAAAMPTPGRGTLDAIASAAIAAHALDRDDLHWDSVTHPGSMVWPALLAVGDRHSLPLRAVLDAGVLGYQVTVRTARLLGPDHRAGFHVSTTAGTIGVAAAVATLLGHDERHLVTAVSHAASTLGGTAQAVAEHSRTAQLHRGVAAVTGTLAAYNATLDPGVVRPLDGPRGFAAATGVELQTDSLDQPIGPAIEATTIRVHPVNGFCHTLVDALLGLPHVEPARIRRVEVSVPAFVAAATETDGTAPPTTPAWNLPHIVALCLAGALPSPRLPAADADTITPLRELVAVRTRTTTPPDLVSEAVLTLDDGRTLRGRVEVPHGHPADPLSDDELIAKAVGLRSCSQADGRALLDRLATATGRSDDLPIRIP